MTKKPKVVLFVTNTRWYGRRPKATMPYAVLILSALLKDEFDFEILDAYINNYSEQQCAEKLKEMAPAIVLVSGFSVEYHKQYHAAIGIAKSACPNCLTVMGGVYPTVMGEDVMKDPHTDYIFLGHAEERICEFLKTLIGGDKQLIEAIPGIGFRNRAGDVVINPVKSYIADVKIMAKPDYAHMNVKAYLNQELKNSYQLSSPLPTATIMSSYGCPYNCVFCATRTISGRKIAFRPYKDVLEEIEFFMKEHGIRHFAFLDDCIVADKKRFENLLNEFINRHYNISWVIANVSSWHLNNALLELMHRAGCKQLTVAVESGSQRVLREIIRKPLQLEIIPPIVKKCKELGIDIGAFFVIGFPGETWDEIRETGRFAEKCDFDIVYFSIATPLPKTDLYQIAKDQGVLSDDFNFQKVDFFGYGQAFIETNEFTAFELKVFRAFEWDRINFSSQRKIVKIAQMMNITLEELKEFRKQTRLNTGIYFKNTDPK